MAGSGRKTRAASAVALCLLWGGGGSAATVIAGPGTPETLIHDAHLTIASSLAVSRSVPPPPVRADFMEQAALVAAYAGCVAAGTSAATSVGSSVGYLWVATRCLRPAGAPVPVPAPIAVASLFLPPPPAPYWPADGAPSRLPVPGGGVTGPRPHIAPVPLPVSGLALPGALGLLLAFGRRRRWVASQFEIWRG